MGAQGLRLLIPIHHDVVNAVAAFIFPARALLWWRLPALVTHVRVDNLGGD